MPSSQVSLASPSTIEPTSCWNESFLVSPHVCIASFTNEKVIRDMRSNSCAHRLSFIPSPHLAFSTEQPLLDHNWPLASHPLPPRIPPLSAQYLKICPHDLKDNGYKYTILKRPTLVTPSLEAKNASSVPLVSTIAKIQATPGMKPCELGRMMFITCLRLSKPILLLCIFTVAIVNCPCSKLVSKPAASNSKAAVHHHRPLPMAS